MKRFLAVCAAAALLVPSTLAFAGCADKDSSVVLRVSNWEEYIDLGEWEDDELIDIGEDGIIGVNSMVDDFTEWFNSTHDFKVRVEYSTFGTNEDLYNRLKLGDVYDLVCPSDYMLMKLIAEEAFVEFSDAFWDLSVEENYYANNVSGYIDGADGEGIFNDEEYNWHKKAACYMWGTTGIVYNPEEVPAEDVSGWDILLNEEYNRRVTVKDNVRDAYFATLGIINGDKLAVADKAERSAILNDTDDDTISRAQEVLKSIKDNVYSFETDSGKADMVTGKVVANYQWSGDAVYIMDEADADETELWYSVPDECTNLWFDGWMMLKDGIDGNERRQTAAEAFVNFLSRPDNAVRNMYYIGYTSAIAGETVFEYMDWNYGAEEDEEQTLSYDLSYFFGEDSVLTVGAADFEVAAGGGINRGRQLFAQYPPQNVIDRSVVMLDFGEKLADINRMWINVRCPDLKDFSPVTVGVVAALCAAAAAGVCLYVFRYRLFIDYRPKKGFEKV